MKTRPSITRRDRRALAALGVGVGLGTLALVWHAWPAPVALHPGAPLAATVHLPPEDAPRVLSVHADLDLGTTVTDCTCPACVGAAAAILAAHRREVPVSESEAQSEPPLKVGSWPEGEYGATVPSEVRP